MNLKELAAEVAKQANISEAAATRAIKAFAEITTVKLTANEPVRILGFGTFDTSPIKERTRRNPKTGETFIQPAGRRIVFKAHDSMKQRF